MRICAWFKLLGLNNQNAVYTQVSRGNVFTCTSVGAAILKNLKDNIPNSKNYRTKHVISDTHISLTPFTKQ